jgi:hopanoid biosynthesis associated RND transporter like protein HpnN
MKTLIWRMVAASCRRAWVVVLLVAALAVGALAYVAGHFAMTTDTAQLISPKTPWRQQEAVIDRAFPDTGDQLVVVIDGATPELAESAAASMTAALERRTDLVKRVDRPDGGPFFAQNGLLFLSQQEVNDVTGQLIKAQPVLGPLAADPSLRGVMDGVATLMQAAQAGQADLNSLDPLVSGLADEIQALEQGKSRPFSWQALMGSGGQADLSPKRRILLVQPALDYSALEPAARVREAIHETAQTLKLDPAHYVRVRITGSPALADEEFSSLAENAWLVSLAMVAAIILMLWLAVRSWRMLLAILITTFAGLILTAGVGLLAVGRFNLISVAFIPLFVGLGIDFGIQLMVRFRAERLEGLETPDALRGAAQRVGPSLVVAALAISLGFFAFLPTAYVGVSELGVIAGLGMLIALALTGTLLPALVVLLGVRPQRLAVGYAWFAPVDAFLLRRRRVVLGAFGLSVVVSAALLPLVRFDFNPLHLRNPNGEAMRTLADLMSDPQRTPYTIDILRPSLQTADAEAARLDKLPQVDSAVTLSSFVPQDQAPKLATIQDASLLLDTAVNPIESLPPPTDAERVQSIAKAAAALRAAAGTSQTKPAQDARRLATALDRLAVASPELRDRVQTALVAPLGVALDQIRNLLAAQPVTLQSLPAQMKRDWMTPDGRAKIQVLPKGNAADNAVLKRFAKAVQTLAPDASGGPISIQAAAHTIAMSFVEAGILSLIAVSALLLIYLRSVKEVAFTLAPVVLSGFLTLATCVVINQPINFANIIAFPLLFGVGVAFHIYFVMAWRAGETNLLQSPLTRAVLFSALTTGVAFGSLWLSTHPGTASMGKILMISIVWTLVCALLFEPALLGPPEAKAGPAPAESEAG